MTRIAAALFLGSRLISGGSEGASGDANVGVNSIIGRPATELEINHPTGLAILGSSTLYIGSYLESGIHKLDVKTGLMTTIGDSGQLMGPADIAGDAMGNLIAALTLSCRVVGINVTDGSVQAIAGRAPGPNGPLRGCGSSGDAGPAVDALVEPNFIASDTLGNLFIVDYSENRVRRIDRSSGMITTVLRPQQTKAARSVAVGRDTLFVSQQGSLAASQPILSVNPKTGAITPLRKSSFSRNKDLWKHGKDGWIIFADSLSNLYVLGESRVYYMDLSTHSVSIVAGTKKGFSGDGGPANRAQLYWPTSVVLDGDGNIYIADSENQRVRRIDAKTRIITTIAGNGKPDHVPGTLELSSDEPAR